MADTDVSAEVYQKRYREKPYSEEELKVLTQRLNRVEGQIHGVRRMLENNIYCTDILIQVSAATAAMHSFAKVLMTEHLKNCVAEDIRGGNLDSVDEFVATIQKMMK